MFLSKLQLNSRNPFTRRDLAAPYEMHRTLLNGGFDTVPKDELGRVLFRVDTDRFGGNPLVLVQSEREPKWENLPDNYLGRPAEAKPLDLVVSKHQKLRFRLRANPTKRVAAKNERLGGVMAGKRVGLVTESEQIAWLLRKAEGGGFRVPGGWVDAKHPETELPIKLPNFRVDAISEGRARNDKAGHHDGVFAAVRFDGVLEVTDPDKFKETVFAGVGSAKGYGFGLLSIGPV